MIAIKQLKAFYKVRNILHMQYLPTCFVWETILAKRFFSSKSQENTVLKENVKNGPGLEYFIANSHGNQEHFHGKKTAIAANPPPYIDQKDIDGTGKKVYVEVYGCQMNVNDTEIIYSVLNKHNYSRASRLEEADVAFLMTCAIREGAEHKIWRRLEQLRHLKEKKRKREMSHFTVGVIGCMAERLKHQLLEKERSVDIIAGPDSYRQLPYLISQATSHQAAIDVILSLDETYADVVPVRINPASPSAYVSIMRGCDNMCTYCIVPFTRGRERSRPIDSIVDEIRYLADQGVKEIVLLGQNVNSYRDTSESTYYGIAPDKTSSKSAPGFGTVYKSKVGGRRFADLLEKVSFVDPEIRIRFTSPHPKDFPVEVIELVRDRPNICKSLHLPAQSGNNRILSLMRRNYTREAYLDLIKQIQNICGEEITFSSDFICGFCSETEDEFQDTMDLVRQVPYSVAFIFPYSLREKTAAHRRYVDDVPTEIKNSRVDRLVQLFRQRAEEINKQLIGSLQLIMIEGVSKRSDQFVAGRNDGNVKVIVPRRLLKEDGEIVDLQIGQYVVVQVMEANSQVLKGVGLYTTTLKDFHQKRESL